MHDAARVEDHATSRHHEAVARGKWHEGRTLDAEQARAEGPVVEEAVAAPIDARGDRHVRRDPAVVRRVAVLDEHADKPLGVLPKAYLGVQLLAIAAGIALAYADPTGKVQNPTTLAAGVVGLILSFRVAGILRGAIAARGLNLGVSSVATFFFGVLYLQYTINRIADALAAQPPPRRKKKKKRKTVTTDGPEPVVGSAAEEPPPG